MEQKEFQALLDGIKTDAEAALDKKILEVKQDTQKTLDETIKTLSKVEELEAFKNFQKESAEEQKKLSEALKVQGDVLTKMQMEGKGKPNVETLIDVVQKNKEQLAASTRKGKDHEFFVKADTLRASVVGNANALDLTTIGQLAHRKLTVYDMFRKVPVPKDSNGVIRYVDWDDATKVRAAAALAEGANFPESTARWATYTLALQKVGDIIPMSEELMYDASMFAEELRNFLETNVAIKIDTDLVNGNGTAPNISGLKNQVPNYTPVASGITDASIYDLIVKLREAISAPYGSKYSPNVVMMNISDINKMKLKKDTHNNYIMPPFYSQAGQLVDGIAVIECNAFAANTLIIGDSRYGAIYEEPGLTVETGRSTGDFESDMMSLKARKRLNLLIRTVDQTGWLEVTSISAALTTLAT